MFRSTLRLIAAPAVAAIIAMAPCAASAQGFLNDIFGNSDRFSPSTGSAQERPQQPARSPQPQAEPQGTVAQGYGDELSQRIVRLEAQIRQLTGAIEQLQYRNQQLEAQVQRMQGGGGAPARAPRDAATSPAAGSAAGTAAAHRAARRRVRSCAESERAGRAARARHNSIRATRQRGAVKSAIR